ncbi:MAG TPA: glycosyltransferase family 4 protein [Candidatus Nanoarchaeia archaeon]|nr:glycosyltransferase family 4 protein [Candidatus Nanoarchaeia archaeon]
MKKILIVADTYVPKMDGIVRFLTEIVPRLTSLDITLLVPDFGKHWNEKEVRLPVSRIISLSGYSPIKLSVSNLRKIRDAVKAADVIFIQGPALISYIALRYSRKFQKRVVHFIHLIMWELYANHLPRWLRWTGFLRWLTISHWYNLCDQLVVPYKGLIPELETLGVTPPKAVVRLGVDATQFAPTDKVVAKQRLGIDAHTLVVGYVGRISYEKNVAVLLEAFQRIKQEFNVLLLIVGSGVHMTMFENVSGVKLAGFQHDVVPYLQAMDVFVMPSLTETTSLATLEAMSCGVPVVTTRVGFLKDYVRKGYNGLTFPRGNTYTLVSHLRKLLSDAPMRAELGEHARQTAHSFSWDNTARKLTDILSKSF